MAEGSGGGLQVVYNVDRILDCNTHLTGMEGESARSILECMDFCGIEKVFLFAPMLDIQRHEITSDSLRAALSARTRGRGVFGGRHGWGPTRTGVPG